MTSQIAFYRIIHSICFTIHIASCIAAFFTIIQDEFAQTQLYYFKYNYTLIESTKYEQMIYEDIGKTNAIAWVAINEGFSALAHLFGICISHVNYPILSSMRRWIFSAMTISLLSCAIVLSLGSTNIFLIVFLFTANVIMQIFGFVLDYIKLTVKTVANSPRLWIFFFIGLFLLVPQIMYVTWSSNTTVGIEGASFINMTALGIIYSSFYLILAIFQMLSITDCCGNYFDYEIIFISLSVATKLILSWTLIANIHNNFKYLNIKTTPDLQNLHWDWVQGILLIGGIMDIIIVLFISRKWKLVEKKRPYKPVKKRQELPTRGGRY